MVDEWDVGYVVDSAEGIDSMLKDTSSLAHREVAYHRPDCTVKGPRHCCTVNAAAAVAAAAVEGCDPVDTADGECMAGIDLDWEVGSSSPRCALSPRAVRCIPSIPTRRLKGDAFRVSGRRNSRRVS